MSTAKPQIYKGKEYPSIKAIALELDLDLPALYRYTKSMSIEDAVSATQKYMEEHPMLYICTINGVKYKTHLSIARFLRAWSVGFNRLVRDLQHGGYSYRDALYKAINTYACKNAIRIDSIEIHDTLDV
jgi:hypothetical protein